MDATKGGTASFSFPDPNRGPLEADSRLPFYEDVSPTYGNFGRQWDNISCTQDGSFQGVQINDGGCGPDNEPESPALLFRRLYQVVIPMDARDETDPSLVRADDWEDAVLNPMRFGGRDLQAVNESCGGSLPPFCAPALNAINAEDGSVNLSPSLSAGSGCDTNAGAFGLTRQIAGGVEEIIGEVEPPGAARDAMTIVGQPHTYRTFAMGSDGRVSAKSAPVTLTPADTAAPLPPVIRSVTPVDSGATVDFQTCNSLGGQSVNFFAASSSGGPYTQVNLQPVYVSGPKQYTVAGLQNGLTYYIVATMVDRSGNESAYSAEFSVTPGP